MTAPSPEPKPPEPPASRLVAGRYLVGEPIGRGRSTVHRGEDRRLRRAVALKEVRLAEGPEGVERARARARREAHAAARIGHPGVVTVFDVVEDGASIWLVMELLEMPSLARVVNDRGPLDHRRAARIGLGVLGALDAAHTVGIVHRDVKPANVLVGAGDTTKLADFGVASIHDESSVTATGTIVGSPSYMAPEQAMAADVGPFTDMWALGATLYFAVEGSPPFAGDSPLATASAVVHGDPRPAANPGVITAVVRRLLDKDAQRRPSARQARAMLASAADGPPLDATLVTRKPARPDPPVVHDTRRVVVPPPEALPPPRGRSGAGEATIEREGPVGGDTDAHNLGRAGRRRSRRAWTKRGAGAGQPGDGPVHRHEPAPAPEATPKGA